LVAVGEGVTEGAGCDARVGRGEGEGVSCGIGAGAGTGSGEGVGSGVGCGDGCGVGCASVGCGVGCGHANFAGVGGGVGAGCGSGTARDCGTSAGVGCGEGKATDPSWPPPLRTGHGCSSVPSGAAAKKLSGALSRPVTGQHAQGATAYGAADLEKAGLSLLVVGVRNAVSVVVTALAAGDRRWHLHRLEARKRVRKPAPHIAHAAVGRVLPLVYRVVAQPRARSSDEPRLTGWELLHAKVKVAQVCLGGKAAKRGEGAGIDTEVHQHVSMHKPQLELNHTGSSQPLRRRPSSRALACRAPLWTDRRLQLCELAQPALALELRAARVEAEFERVDARLHPLHHLQLLGLHACLCPLVRLVERRDPAQHRSLQSSLEAHMQLFLLLLLLRQPRLHPLLPLATREEPVVIAMSPPRLRVTRLLVGAALDDTANVPTTNAFVCCSDFTMADTTSSPMLPKPSDAGSVSDEEEPRTVTLLAPRAVWLRPDVAPFAALYAALLLGFVGRAALHDWMSYFFPLALALHAMAVLVTYWSVELRSAAHFRVVSSLREATAVKVVPVTAGGRRQLCRLLRVNLETSAHFYWQRRKYVLVATGSWVKEGAHNSSFWELYAQQLLAPFFVFQLFCVALWSLDDYWYYSLFTLLMLATFEGTVVHARMRTLSDLRLLAPRPQPVFALRGGKWVRLNSAELVPGDLLSVCRAHGEDSSLCADVVLIHGSAVLNEAMLTGESVPQLKEPPPPERASEPLCMITDRVHVLYAGTSVVQHSAGMQWCSTLQGFRCLREWIQKRLECVCARLGGGWGGFRVVEGTDTPPPPPFKIINIIIIQPRTLQPPLNVALSPAPRWSCAPSSSPKEPRALQPPDGGAVAYVLRTGFATTQGKLMRTILFSKEPVSANNAEVLVYILSLLACALVAAGYVLKSGWADESKDSGALAVQ
ncbi:hypothetical protein T492DRAFT_845878, partial [Pavlovales sp. CCMP2436]